jgi:hypothetical protein
MFLKQVVFLIKLIFFVDEINLCVNKYVVINYMLLFIKDRLSNDKMIDGNI